jgi:hypothetical protein
MSKGKTWKVLGIASVLLAVGGGVYIAGAKDGSETKSGKDQTCAHASATKAATSKECSDKAHAAGKAGDTHACEVKAGGAATTTSADCAKGSATKAAAGKACPHMKAGAAKTSTASATAGECSGGSCDKSAGGSCPMGKTGAGAAKKVGAKASASKDAASASLVTDPPAAK